MATNVDLIFKQSASYEEALSNWERFEKATQKEFRSKFNPPEKVFSFFLKIFGNSSFLSNYAISYPGQVKKVLESPFLFKPKKQSDFQKEIQKLNLLKKKDWLAQLKHYKYSELLRITLKDLNQVSTQEILFELSYLAYEILHMANTLVFKLNSQQWGSPLLPDKTQCQHLIVALGKLGGYELNYSSDVDLIFVTQTDDASCKKITAHEFFVKQAQLLTSQLQQKDEIGFLYRVDWDLRPEGKSGTLVNSLSALENYYETFGADWERQAWTKASYATGSQPLFDELMTHLTPFIYRKYLDPTHITRLRIMNQKIHDEGEKKRLQGFNIKLGIGGIREIEFLAQVFLLIFGGKNPKLRTTTTLQGLFLLKQFKLMSEPNTSFLTGAYLFLRKLENSLQMVHEEQTHLLKEDPLFQTAMAKRMGYQASDNSRVRDEFLTQLNQITTGVHQIFTDLFSEKTLPSFSPTPTNDFQKELSQKMQAFQSEEEKLYGLRIFKKEWLEKIKEQEKNIHASREEIMKQHSDVAETIVQYALDMALGELIQRYGKPVYQSRPDQLTGSDLIILGMGKLGGQEIGYYSDLDLIFIYSENGATTGQQSISNSEFFAKVVQKLISILSANTPCGIAYSIDAELRPSGNFGPLVTSLESFIEYQTKVSQLWERQALLKARPVAGPADFSHLVSSHIKALLYSHPSPLSIIYEMNRLRKRVELELARETDKKFNFKLGKGGMMDIEFILQCQQLLLGSQYYPLQTPNTIEGLEQLARLDLPPGAMDVTLLKDVYLFYRNLESKLSLAYQRSFNLLFPKDPKLEEVAQELQFKNSDDLIHYYLEHRQMVRHIYKKVLGR